MNDMQMRRAPTQKRSRERVDAILATATAMIAETGSDALRMSDLAQRAGISIGSLYQYFPDKTAIIRVLAERISAEGRACIAAELSGVSTTDELREAFRRLVEIYYGLFLAEPVMRDVWSATQADKALRAFEQENSRADGALVAAAMARVRPDADREALERSAFLVMQLGEAAMRIAISVPREEGDALVETYVRMALKEIAP